MKPQTLSEALALKEEFRQWLQAQFDSGSCPFTKEDLSFLGFDLCEGCPDYEDQIPLEPAPEPEPAPLPFKEIKLFPVEEKDKQPELAPPFAVYPHPGYPGYPNWRIPRLSWVGFDPPVDHEPKTVSPFGWFTITCNSTKP